jgi:hypothetical protein
MIVCSGPGPTPFPSKSLLCDPLTLMMERWFMSLGEGAPEAGLPTTHYFLSLSRGEAIRTLMVRRIILWARVPAGLDRLCHRLSRLS